MKKYAANHKKQYPLRPIYFITAGLGTVPVRAAQAIHISAIFSTQIGMIRRYIMHFSSIIIHIKQFPIALHPIHPFCPR